MSVKIKVCGLRHLENINDIIGISPNFIGLILVKESKRFVSTDILEKLLKEQSIAAKAIIVTKDMPLEEVLALPLNAVRGIQLHGSESQEYVIALKKRNPDLLIFKAIGISSLESFSVCDQYDVGVDYFLFDTEIKAVDGKTSGGTGQVFSWDLLSEYKSEKPYFLSGGLGPDNISKVTMLIHEDHRLVGVDLNSRYETTPGFKDVKQLSESFNILRG